MAVTASAQARRPSTAATPGSWVPITLLGLLLLWGMLLFGDRNGLEGDDLALIWGITHFDWLGPAEVYRYYWQPLAYELLRPVSRWLSAPMSLTYAGNAAVALGLALLAVLLRRRLGSLSQRTALAVVLVLAAPELWVTGLYFNTTALAMPAVVGALLLLESASRSHRGAMALTALSGALLMAGIGLRLDFLLVLPFTAVLVLRWWRTWPERLHAMAVAAAGAAAAAVLFLLAHQDLIAGAGAILGTYTAGEYPRTLTGRIKVVVTAIGPLFIVGPWLWRAFRHTSPQRASGHGLLALALLPTLLPLPNLYSGKYLVPFLICALIALCEVIGRRSDEPLPPRRAAGAVACCAAVLSLTALIGIPSQLRQPRLEMLAHPLLVSTHDGPRSAGGYYWLARSIRDFEHRTDPLAVTRHLADGVRSCGKNAVVVMSSDPRYGNNPWNWGWLALYLEQAGWHITSYDHLRRIDMSSPDGKTQLMVLNAAQTAPASPLTVDLRLVQVQPQERFWSAAQRWLQDQPQLLACR